MGTQGVSCSLADHVLSFTFTYEHLSTLNHPRNSSIAPRTNCIGTHLIHSIPSVVLVSSRKFPPSGRFVSILLRFSLRSSRGHSQDFCSFVFPRLPRRKSQSPPFSSFFFPFLFSSPHLRCPIHTPSYTAYLRPCLIQYSTTQSTASIASGPTSSFEFIVGSYCACLHVGSFDSFFSSIDLSTPLHIEIHPRFSSIRFPWYAPCSPLFPTVNGAYFFTFYQSRR